MKPGSDVAFMLEVLRDGLPHSTNEIRRRSFEQRDVGLTVNSRASDLRKHGYDVKCWHDANAGRRDRGWLYQLVGDLPSESTDSSRDRTGSGTTGSGLSDGSPSPQTVSAREPTALLLASEADAYMGRPLSDLDRAAGAAFIEALLTDRWFEVYRGEWDHLPESELRDQELAEEAAEAQRVLFVEAA